MPQTKIFAYSVEEDQDKHEIQAQLEMIFNQQRQFFCIKMIDSLTFHLHAFTNHASCTPKRCRCTEPGFRI